MSSQELMAWRRRMRRRVTDSDSDSEGAWPSTVSIVGDEDDDDERVRGTKRIGFLLILLLLVLDLTLIKLLLLGKQAETWGALKMEMGSSSNSVILLTDTVTAFITAFFLFWTSKFLELTRVTQHNNNNNRQRWRLRRELRKYVWFIDRKIEFDTPSSSSSSYTSLVLPTLLSSNLSFSFFYLYTPILARASWEIYNLC